MRKLIISLIAIILLTQNVDSATFSISSVSTCTQQTTAGFCARWQQNGSVTQTTSCFPSTTQLYVLLGEQQIAKNMSEIKVGDKILSFVHNQPKYTEVIGWLHKEIQSQGKYLQIMTDTKTFEVSAYHNIALMDGTYLFAKQLLNQRLHNGQLVRQIKNITMKGIYAPLTESGNFYVKSGSQGRVLAHCFANIRTPQFYEPFVFTIFKLWEAFTGKYQGQTIHPAAEWMKQTFHTLIEQ